MSSRQRKVLVEVSRIYEYPYAALSPMNPEGDAIDKAEEEFLEEVNNAFHLHGSNFEKFFEIHAIAEKEFIVDLEKIPGPKGKVLFKIKTLAEKLAIYELCKKYEVKELTYEHAPDLMELVPAKKTPDGEIIEEHFKLKKVPSLEFSNMLNKYNKMLMSICNKNMD